MTVTHHSNGHGQDSNFLQSSGLMLCPNTPYATRLDPNIEATVDNAILVEILRAATQIASASTSIERDVGTSQPDYLAFPLAHLEGLDHIRDALRAHDLDDSKLHFEYYPDRGELRLKMPTTFHDQCAARIEAVVSTAAGAVLGVAVRGFECRVPIQGESGLPGNLYADIGWTLSPIDPAPCFIIEVAFSQHRTNVSTKLQEHIVGSGGRVRAAVGVKIDYRTADSYESIRHNLDECFICL